MVARHASPLEALLVDERFGGEINPFEPMSRHTTYRIGGPARYFARVHSVGALARVLEACKAMGKKWYIVGRGSNLLVADEGVDAAVIVLGRDFRSMRYDEEKSRLMLGAGVPLSAAVQEAFRRSLAGLEFAVGTPGSVGGALRMNAGSRDEWLGARVESVTSFSAEGGLVRRHGSEIEWGYRCSSFPADEILVECELNMEPADPFYIRGKMEASLKRRKATQPLRQPSCGSVFKNPEGASAGDLIERAGLKGSAVGGARISDVHANFIVNTGNATARDVLSLIELVQGKVLEAYGVALKPEVKLLGFE